MVEFTKFMFVYLILLVGLLIGYSIGDMVNDPNPPARVKILRLIGPIVLLPFGLIICPRITWKMLKNFSSYYKTVMNG